MLQDAPGRARMAEPAALILVPQIRMRVHLHRDQVARAVRLRQPARHAGGNRMLPAQHHQQLRRGLPAQQARHRAGHPLDHRLRRLELRPQRRQRMHPERHRRLAVKLPVVLLHFARRGEDRRRAAPRAGRVRSRGIIRHRQNPRARALTLGQFRRQAEKVILALKPVTLAHLSGYSGRRRGRWQAYIAFRRRPGFRAPFRAVMDWRKNPPPSTVFRARAPARRPRRRPGARG